MTISIRQVQQQVEAEQEQARAAQAAILAKHQVTLTQDAITRLTRAENTPPLNRESSRSAHQSLPTPTARSQGVMKFIRSFRSS